MKRTLWQRVKMKFSRRERRHAARSDMDKFINLCLDSTIYFPESWKERWTKIDKGLVEFVSRNYMYKPITEAKEEYASVLSYGYGESPYHLEMYIGDWGETLDIQPSDILHE
ncbi:hypothetical protein HYV49_03270 [Candidatus Pacearchaeota archaeon]|nr:hypothetical protein [Candidatus Pacearchaeota archaeon]